MSENNENVNMCAIIVKQCILHGKYNNSLTFIAQKTADETPQIKPLEKSAKGPNTPPNILFCWVWFPETPPKSTVCGNHKLPRFVADRKILTVVAKSSQLQQDCIEIQSRYNLRINPSNPIKILCIVIFV
jgi:hypothetical protein